MAEMMTLEEVRDRLRADSAYWERKGGARTVQARLLKDYADAIDAHLTQPAQAVDVGAVLSVCNELRYAAGGNHAWRVTLADRITRALGNAQAEVRVWRCTQSMSDDGGTCYTREYAKTEADMLILRDKGYACELLPTPPQPEE